MHPKVERLLSREHVEQHTQLWFEKRLNKVTASECSSILGENRYQSRRRLLLKKLGFQEELSWFGKKCTSHGNQFEDEAADKYAALTGKQLSQFGLMEHQDYPWIGASPDRVSTDGVVVEIKCPLKRKIDPGVVPQHYLAQVRLQMEVLDLDECDFVQYIPESTWSPMTLDITRLRRDAAWWNRALPMFQAFYAEWRSLQDRLQAGGPGAEQLRAQLALEFRGRKRGTRPPAPPHPPDPYGWWFPVPRDRNTGVVPAVPSGGPDEFMASSWGADDVQDRTKSSHVS